MHAWLCYTRCTIGLKKVMPKLLLRTTSANFSNKCCTVASILAFQPDASLILFLICSALKLLVMVEEFESAKSVSWRKAKKRTQRRDVPECSVLTCGVYGIWVCPYGVSALCETGAGT